MHRLAFTVVPRLVVLAAVITGSWGCGRKADNDPSGNSASADSTAPISCDAESLRRAADEARAARIKWAPSAGIPFDHADAAASSIASACNTLPVVVGFSLATTVDLGKLSLDAEEDGHDPTSHRGRRGGAPPTQADWDAVAEDLCPDLVAIASTAGVGPKSLYERCGLTASSGMGPEEFVDAGGSIVTVGLLKTRRWLAAQSDPSTAEALVESILERWYPLRFSVAEAGVRLPATTNGQPLPKDRLEIRLSRDAVWVGPRKAAMRDEPALESILRDAVTESLGLARAAGGSPTIVVAADRDLPIPALSTGLASLDVGPIQLVVLVDDVDAPLRTVAFEDVAGSGSTTIQDQLRGGEGPPR